MAKSHTEEELPPPPPGSSTTTAAKETSAVQKQLPQTDLTRQDSAGHERSTIVTSEKIHDIYFIYIMGTLDVNEQCKLLLYKLVGR